MTSAITLAKLERPHALTLWAWAWSDEGGAGDYLDVQLLGADGRPVGGLERGRALRTDAPVGAAAWLVSPGGAGAAPCVVLGKTEDGARLRVLSARGEHEAAPEWLWPVASPGARPHAAGENTALRTVRRPGINQVVNTVM